MVQRVLAVVALLLPLVLAGCVSDFRPARVAQGELPDGWTAEDPRTEQVTSTLRVTVFPYRSERSLAGSGPPQAGLAVASFNDLPVVDEDDALQQAMDHQVGNVLDVLRQHERVEDVELRDWRNRTAEVRDGETADTSTARLHAHVRLEGDDVRRVTGNVTLWRWQDAEQPMVVVAAGYALDDVGGGSGPFDRVVSLLSDGVVCHEPEGQGL